MSLTAHQLAQWGPLILGCLIWLFLALANWAVLFNDRTRRGERSGSLVAPLVGVLIAAGIVIGGPLEEVIAWAVFLAMVLLDPGSLVIPIIMGLRKGRK
jgi:hypothetical protein